MPDIEFYCGLEAPRWNRHTAKPGSHVCIAPCTSVSIEDRHGVKRRQLRKTTIPIDGLEVSHVLLDSGAFSDGIEVTDGKIVSNDRLSFDHALQRQFAHAYEFRYAHLVEGIVSYDCLIDEVWMDGERSKKRWSKESSEFAVTETINAAKYLVSQRKRIDGVFNHHVKLILSAQGVSAEQYKRCAEEIVAVMEHDDIFGLGGWCITGLRRYEMLPFAAMCLPNVFGVLGGGRRKTCTCVWRRHPKVIGILALPL